MSKLNGQLVFKILSAVGFVLSIVFFIYGFKTGIFTSQTKLESFIDGFGAAGVVVFVLFQAVQVVLPILPGGIGCLAGTILFGMWQGFIYNYIGICVGSILAFMVAKYYGKPLLSAFFSKKMIDKYDKWTSSKNRFTKMFAVAIFLPVAPDDFLCYLAGTTEMSLTKFTVIILACKPFAIGAYSFGLMAAFTGLTSLIGG